MNKIKNKKAFTLIEILTAIIIITVLSAISVVSYSLWKQRARDSVRISDIKSIENILWAYSVKNWWFPIPDNYWKISYSVSLLWYQWTIWDRIKIRLNDILKEKPVDPLTWKEYFYSLSNKQDEYELLALYETSLSSEEFLNYSIGYIENFYPRIDWPYNKIFLKTSNFIFPTPSIFTAEKLWKWETLEIDENTIKSQIITWWENVLYNWKNKSVTGSLNINLSVYPNFVWINSSDSEKVNLAKSLQGAYTGSILQEKYKYKKLLEKQTDEELIDYVDEIIFNK